MSNYESYQERRAQLAKVVEEMEIRAGIRDKVAAFQMYQGRSDIREVYFGVPDRELRKQMIAAYRAWQKYYDEESFPAQIADAEPELAKLRRKGAEVPWIWPSVMASAAIALGYAIASLPGALGGAVVGFFIGQSHIGSTRAEHQREIDEAEADLQRLRSESKRSDFEIALDNVFTETEERTGCEAEGDDKPIHIAALMNNAIRVKAFLDAGVSVHESNGESRGSTPLHRAAAAGSLEVVKVLIEAGADVNTPNTIHMWSPMFDAAAHGHADVIRALVAAGASVDAVDRYGSQPIHYAAQRGTAESVKALLDAGAAVDAKDSNHGNTPLHVAAVAGKVDITAELLAAGANPAEPNIHGATPIDLAKNNEAIA